MIFPCPNPFSQLKAKFDLYYAAINHNHDADYAPIDHNHDERYYTEAEVDALIAGAGPIVGEIRMWPKSIWPPTNWFYCIGTEISRETYSALFDVIGTQFGVGDGSTTFNLPDFTGRFPVGADDIGPPYRPVGTTGGEEEHTLTISEMPEHDHPTVVRAPTSAYHCNNFGAGYSTNYGLGNNTNQNTGQQGGDQPHNNMPPYLAVYFIIYAGPT